MHGQPIVIGMQYVSKDCSATYHNFIKLAIYLAMLKVLQFFSIYSQINGTWSDQS